MTSRKIVFDWQPADHFGWGIYGLNLIVHATALGHMPIPLQKPSFLYPLDPLSRSAVQNALSRASGEIKMTREDLVLSALGNGVSGPKHKGPRNLGVIFFENAPLSLESIARLKEYDAVVTGSSWNAQVLRAAGVRVENVIQGVDQDHFRPQEKRFLKNRFVVFSGGKLEYRKGQDILVKAFSIFSKRHSDAILISAWRSPWDKGLSTSVNESGLCAQLRLEEDVGKSMKTWLIENDIDERQFFCLEAVPNRLMPDVFREVDLAVFPNRCEGGTNLVAMEALSSGTCCIISANSGQLDLIQEDNCLVLSQQSPISRAGCEGWGESSVEELLELMEQRYTQPDVVLPSMARSSIAQWTWPSAVQKLVSIQ